MEETWFPRMCQQRMLEWKQIWFSCLYDSDLRKIDAQIRYNKSSLGLFYTRNEEKFKFAETLTNAAATSEQKRVSRRKGEKIWIGKQCIS